MTDEEIHEHTKLAYEQGGKHEAQWRALAQERANEIERLDFENKRLRAALEAIANGDHDGGVLQFARAALEGRE